MIGGIFMKKLKKKIEELFDQIEYELKIGFFSGRLDSLIDQKYKDSKITNRIWIVGGTMDNIQNRLNSTIIPLSTETEIELVDSEMITKKELKFLKRKYKINLSEDSNSLILYRPKQIELYFMFGEN